MSWEFRLVMEPVANSGMEDTPQDESWKHEVASRLDTYRSKSQRKLSGDFSMRFNFDGEPAPPRQQICVPAVPSDIEPEINDAIAESAAAPFLAPPQVVEEAEPQPVLLPQTVPPSLPPPLRPSVPFKRRVVMEANVIEFPRLFPPEPPPSYSLADPILPTMPRILDAPEIGQPLLETPILDGMRLEHLDNRPAPQIELPLQVAPVTRRLYASALDCAIVLIASGIFAMLAVKMLPGLEWTKPLLGSVAVVPVLFWAVYQCLFLIYGARTPGMAISQLAFSTFQGTAPNRHQRSLRVVGMALSCSSLMLGFLWAFFDEDTLCWHDRVSRTYCYHQK